MIKKLLKLLSIKQQEWHLEKMKVRNGENSEKHNK